MDVHLVDGTYELFRYFYSPGGRRGEKDDRHAVRGVVASMLALLESGATHVGVATDHVIESFRNDLYRGYKTGEGVDPDLLSQFDPLETALAAFGFTVWPMVEWEADDALASAAAVANGDTRVGRIFVCSPDKDLAQCVRGNRVVQLDRRSGEVRDAAGVERKFGVPPASIADWLALVGDSADGYPGLPGWGARSAATLLARFGSIDAIPASAGDWDVKVRGAERLATALAAGRAEATLFRRLATLRTDAPVGVVDDWRWRGPEAGAVETAIRIGDERLAARAGRLAERLG
jgi:5'-3' exonuclease